MLNLSTCVVPCAPPSPPLTHPRTFLSISHLITTIDLDETGRVLEIHNANIQRNKDTHVFTTVADELEISLEAANNLTLDLNLQLNARLNDSVNSFSATNASTVVGQVQYYLHDFTLDKFYFLHPDILDIWTVRLGSGFVHVCMRLL